MPEAEQTISASMLLGRWIGFMNARIAALPAKLLALVTPGAIQTAALRAALIRKGLLTKQELDELEAEAQAGMMIENTIGATAQGIEKELEEFRAGLWAALGVPAPAAPEEEPPQGEVHASDCDHRR